MIPELFLQSHSAEQTPLLMQKPTETPETQLDTYGTAARTLAFEHLFKTDFPFCGGALHLFILHFVPVFILDFELMKSDMYHRKIKKEEKLKKGGQDAIVQSFSHVNFQVDVRRKHSPQSAITYWKRLLGKLSISGDFQRVPKNLIYPRSLLSVEQRTTGEQRITVDYWQLPSKISPPHNFMSFSKKKNKYKVIKKHTKKNPHTPKQYSHKFKKIN